MRFDMKFFTRSKVLSIVLKVIVGFIAVFVLLDILTVKALLGAVILLPVIIALDCIVKDAKEDFEAIVRMIEHAEGKNIEAINIDQSGTERGKYSD